MQRLSICCPHRLAENVCGRAQPPTQELIPTTLRTKSVSRSGAREWPQSPVVAPPTLTVRNAWLRDSPATQRTCKLQRTSSKPCQPPASCPAKSPSPQVSPQQKTLSPL